MKELNTRIRTQNKAPTMMLVLTLCVLLFGHVTGQTAPNSCSYVSGNQFFCDYTVMNSAYRPIDYSGFSPTPQSIEVKVNGFVPYKTDSRMFNTGFSGINKASFDNNFPARIDMICERKGSAYFRDDTFANMSHIQSFKIRDCEISYISGYAFEEFEYLDYFGIERGSLTLMSAYGMMGVSVEKLTTDIHTIPQNLGMFEILYTSLPSNSIPAGFLANFKNLTSITMKGCSILTMPFYTFTYNTQIRFMDLSENLFSTLYGSIFSGMNSLTEVRLYDIEWECSCANLWFVSYTRDSNVTMFGDFMCYSGNMSTGQSIYKYYYSNCITSAVCKDGQTGFEMMNQCMTVMGTVSKSLGFIALCMNVSTLIIAIVTVKQANVRKNTSNPRAKWNAVRNKMMKNRKKRNIAPRKL